MKLARCLLLLVSCLAYSSTLEMKAKDGRLSTGRAQMELLKDVHFQGLTLSAGIIQKAYTIDNLPFYLI
jgi:copper homeostasis protein CutC